MPSGFLSKLTFLNILVILSVIVLSSWAIYNTACSLVGGIGNLSDQKQNQFNTTLFQYLLLFCSIAVVLGGLVHFYFLKRIIHPINQLIDSTKLMQQGSYPDPILEKSNGEIGELIEQFNRLIHQMQTNEIHRTRLVADLSHEFRTPLTNLNGYLHGLENGVIKGDKEIYQHLHMESKRLIQMIEQLEKLKEWDYISEQVITKKQLVNMDELINQCISIFKWALIQEQIPIAIDVESVELEVRDEAMKQVVHNLLDNAVRYYDGDSPIIVKGKMEKDAYHISITSPGEPIPEGARDKVFERFYRVDDSRTRKTGGTGLGLAIAKEIVNKHNGEIGVDTARNLNTFWFTLPCS